MTKMIIQRVNVILGPSGVSRQFRVTFVSTVGFAGKLIRRYAVIEAPKVRIRNLIEDRILKALGKCRFVN